MDRIVNVLEEAKDQKLISLASAKLALKVDVNDNSLDAVLTNLIERTSGEISTMAMRTFAKERVEESFWNIAYSKPVLWLSHWPVETVESVTQNDYAITGYEVDKSAGKIIMTGNGMWSTASTMTPIRVIYTGGYDLPERAPLALQQAAVMVSQQFYREWQQGGGSAIRMISHKEARVMYYNPNSSAQGTGPSRTSSIGSDSPAVRNLVSRFIRYEV